MKLKNIASVPGVVLLLAGCKSVLLPSATGADGTIENSSLGF